MSSYAWLHFRAVFPNPVPAVPPTLHSFVVALDTHLIQLIEGLMISWQVEWGLLVQGYNKKYVLLGVLEDQGWDKALEWSMFLEINDYDMR
jgi:hypothetical protein